MSSFCSAQKYLSLPSLWGSICQKVNRAFGAASLGPQSSSFFDSTLVGQTLWSLVCLPSACHSHCLEEHPVVVCSSSSASAEAGLQPPCHLLCAVAAQESGQLRRHTVSNPTGGNLPLLLPFGLRLVSQTGTTLAWKGISGATRCSNSRTERASRRLPLGCFLQCLLLIDLNL